MHHLHAEWALLDDGFAPDVRISVDAAGRIAEVRSHAEPDGAERIAGLLLPGMADLHSHAFQRVFAGHTQWTGGGSDFWSWRDAMFRVAGRMTPDLYTPVTAWLCKELLKGGFTALGEFHYLHRAPDFSEYVPRTAMAEALLEGAAQAGMPVTLLITQYETGGFAGEALRGGQRRFENTAEAAIAMAGALSGRDCVIGLAPHSLRAVPPASLDMAISAFTARHAGPIHIHVAEQMREVEDCVRAMGAPPVSWLLDHAMVNESWCLIHATHATAQEIGAATRAGATIGLCPSTEADLGDGIFRFQALLDAEGCFGIGTDSNTALHALGELRLLEYSQRLSERRRNIAARPDINTGQALWQAAARGGARACGRNAGRIASGMHADFCVLAASIETLGAAPARLLDAAMFATSAPDPFTAVMVNGAWIVQNGRHRHEESIDAAYARALSVLHD